MKMKMEGLPLHLCRCHYNSLPSVYPLPFLFLLFTITMSCFASPSQACPGFTCGKDFFEYPFGELKSGCGDPALQLECDPTVNMTLINISGSEYYVTWHDPFMKIMDIIEKNIWSERCNILFINHTTEIRSSTQFHITDENTNLTLWRGCTSEDTESVLVPLACNGSWFVNSKEGSNLRSKCTSNVTFSVSSLRLPISREFFVYEGFKIQWDLSESCKSCESPGRHCAYDGTNPSHIYCTRPKSGAVGSAALLLMGALLLFLNRKKRILPTSSPKPDLSGVEKFLQDYVHQMPCRYSYSQLTKITNKFAHKVGEGGFGVVYKGKLPTGELVAVKMLDQSRRCENQFMNEVATLGRIHHVHLVRLMGYFYEEHRNALVYEYMANGSLDEFIFAGREKEATLNWAQLYPIALGAARGIAYLHQDCDNRIIHFDIKPHNILLDVDFTPKIADFGLAKLCGRGDNHISMTAARGTPGYAAPEVWNRNLGPVTDKSDVYSFGMVLLEMVGGRKNVDVQVSRSSQLYFPEWAFKLMEKGELERGLRGSGIAEIECEEKEKAIRLAKVGMWCIQYNSGDRPNMSRVVQMLEGNCDDVGNPPLPFNSSNRAAPSIQSSEESSL